ncbi:hypothetical protein T4D_9436 [Trichinella pseudospiralis]|uniref:Uncharacterized protein n=1 Tax=Trichinella pseudospiralis TaxID=6337 RepID=A0A0V1FG19_TRIPS|nr:hypothetical protein T4D_9436 [Trichinella pseudospiralis]
MPELIRFISSAHYSHRNQTASSQRAQGAVRAGILWTHCPEDPYRGNLMTAVRVRGTPATRGIWSVIWQTTASFANDLNDALSDLELGRVSPTVSVGRKSISIVLLSTDIGVADLASRLKLHILPTRVSNQLSSFDE